MVGYLNSKLLWIVNSVVEAVNLQPFVTLLLGICSWFAGTREVLLVMLFAVMADLATGLIRAWKEKRKITSFRLRDTVIKLFLYCLTYLLVFAIAKATLWNAPLANVAASLVLLTEAVSVCENVDAMTGGKLGLAALLKRIRAKRMKQVEDGLGLEKEKKK